MDALLAAERESLFVGREKELGLADDLIRGALEPTRILWFHAPGGFGKSTLLDRIQDRHDRTVRWNADGLPRDREQLVARFERLLEDVQDGSEPVLWIIDQVEAHAALENVYFDELFPRLPAHVRVVAAGRSEPGRAIRVDAGWARILEACELAVLSDRESRELLRRRGVSRRRCEELVDATAGHPLTLACLAHDADARPAPSAPLQLPEISVGLLRTNAHALAALALMPLARLETLAGALPVGLEAALENTIATLPFVRSGVEGFTLHPLYQAPILCALMTLEPDAVADVRRRAIRLLADKLDGRRDYAARLEITLAWPYVLRGLPGSEHLDHHDRTHFWDRLGPGDGSILEGLVASSGDAALQAHLDRHREASERLRILRDEARRPVGFLLWLDLAETHGGAESSDPVLRAIRSAGVRSGLLLRGWECAESGQSPSVSQSELVARSVAEAFARPDLPRYLMAIRDLTSAQHWLDGGLLQRFEHLEAPAGQNAIVGYDFSESSPSDWMRAALGGGRPTTPPPPAPGEPASREELGHAVRAALRDMHDDVRLSCGALAERVGGHGPPAARAERVRAVLRNAMMQLPSPADGTSHAALIERAFFARPGKQRAIAEDLGMSYGTFRRRLRRAVDNLVGRVEWMLARAE
ncbi:MAG: hypothetical protein EVA89_02530 [Sandaracinaceae bacterium]|nr:MAG: hypothetical protein EVA89_02530 [Sandaracinaceae bacterium]